MFVFYYYGVVVIKVPLFIKNKKYNFKRVVGHGVNRQLKLNRY